MKLGKLGKRFKVFTWILTGIALVLIYKFDNVFRNPGVPLLQTLPYMAFLFCAGGLILLREGLRLLIWGIKYVCGTYFFFL